MRLAPCAIPHPASAAHGETARRAPEGDQGSELPAAGGTVEEGLQRRWSPQQTSARLKVDHPVDQAMRISHETIYR